jgi:hypothetical protein
MKYIKSYLKNSLEEENPADCVILKTTTHNPRRLKRCAKMYSSKYLFQFVRMQVNWWKHRHCLAPHHICKHILIKSKHQEGKSSTIPVLQKIPEVNQ